MHRIAINISRRCRWGRWFKGFTFAKGETFSDRGLKVSPFQKVKPFSVKVQRTDDIDRNTATHPNQRCSAP